MQINTIKTFLDIYRLFLCIHDSVLYTAVYRNAMWI